MKMVTKRGATKKTTIDLCWLTLVILVGFFTVVIVSGCATTFKAMYEPVVKYALEKAEQNLTDKVDEIIHEAATKPIPALPPAGSSWTEYGVWIGTVAMGSLAVLVDRRQYHRSRVGGVPLVQPKGPPPPMPDVRTG